MPPASAKHFIRRNPSVGVAACKADPAETEDEVAAMAEIDDAQKEKEQHATKKRQLDKNTASMSAASEAAASTQLAMDTCKRAVTRLMWMQQLHASSMERAPSSTLWHPTARFTGTLRHASSMERAPRGLWGAWGCNIHQVPKNRIIQSTLTNTVI